MPPLISTGATATCSFGVAPAVLTAVPSGTPVMAGTPAATIMDHTLASLPTFAMCNTPSNPVVAAATAAKLGVFTPAPCVPAVVAPWMPGAAQVMINNMPALHSGCTAMCTWGGVITIGSPGNAGTIQVS